jgi:CheY-like chemotaxis protein
MSTALNSFCQEVICVRTGIEAVEVCRNRPDVDLILMDIRMTEMNGLEATKQIRQFNKDVVIIAQTAYGQPLDKDTLIMTGFNAFINKPFNLELLIELINIHMAGK